MPLKTKGDFSSTVAFGLSKRRYGRNSSCLTMQAWSILGLPGTQSPACLWDLSLPLSSGCQPSLLLSSAVFPSPPRLLPAWCCSSTMELGTRNDPEVIVEARSGTMCASLGHSHSISQKYCPFPKRQPLPYNLIITLTLAVWVTLALIPLNLSGTQFLHLPWEKDKNTHSSSDRTMPSEKNLERLQLSFEWYSGWIQTQLRMRDFHPTGFRIGVMFS